MPTCGLVPTHDNEANVWKRRTRPWLTTVTVHYTVKALSAGEPALPPPPPPPNPHLVPSTHFLSFPFCLFFTFFCQHCFTRIGLKCICFLCFFLSRGVWGRGGGAVVLFAGVSCQGGALFLSRLQLRGGGLFMSLSTLCTRPYLHSLFVVKYSKV